MKNMFGIGPGTKYGWSKNILRWKGVHRSILDICAPAPIHAVIADAVIASGGGLRVCLVDWTQPQPSLKLDRASRFLGASSPRRIDLIRATADNRSYRSMCYQSSRGLIFASVTGERGK